MPTHVRSARRLWAQCWGRASARRSAADVGPLSEQAAAPLPVAALARQAVQNEQYSIQQQYDNAFAQCMYSKGNMVPGYGPMMVNAPPPPPAPDTSLTYAVQQQLIRLGYLRPPADGVSGPRTSTAISQYESVYGLPVDGIPSPPLLARLQATP